MEVIVDGHESLTKYLEKLKAGEMFDEQTEKGMNVLWNHIQRRMAHLTHVTRVDYHKPGKDICNKLLEIGDAYLKHRTYVDNVSTVFPEMMFA